MKDATFKKINKKIDKISQQCALINKFASEIQAMLNPETSAKNVKPVAKKRGRKKKVK